MCAAKDWDWPKVSSWVFVARGSVASRAEKVRGGWTKWLGTGGGRSDGDEHATAVWSTYDGYPCAGLAQLVTDTPPTNQTGPYVPIHSPFIATKPTLP